MLKLSVTDLVNFSAREGDLYFDESMGSNAQEGVRGHQQLQKAREAPWQIEKQLCSEFLIDDETIQLGGRVDLCNESVSPIIIEEIKTCYGAAYLRDDSRVDIYWAQLKVYVALYGRCHVSGVSQNVQMCLTYYDLDSRQVFQQREIITIEQADVYCVSLLRKYWQWWRLVQEKHAKSKVFLQQLLFPFKDYRPGQRETAVTVFRHLRDKQSLLLEAPTGSGKTVSVLYPALKAYAYGHVNQIVYLTPKGSAQINALKALRAMGIDTQLDCLVIQAKEKSCQCNQRDGGSENPGVCAMTLGFYDRLPEAREAALNVGVLGVSELQRIAENYQLCPFAFSIHLIPWFSLVIADVNYFFDPLVQLSCFANDCAHRVVLIDEVHNLPARARDMYSASLSSETTKEVLADIPRFLSVLKKPMNQLLRALNALNPEDDLQKALKEIGLLALNVFSVSQGLMVEQRTATYLILQNWMKQLYRFSSIVSLMSNAHYLFVDVNGQECVLHIRCLDASDYLRENYKKARAVIGFSATLQPFTFIRQQLGMADNVATVSMPDWFPERNRLQLCCQFVDTGWKRRKQSLDALIDTINGVIKMQPGNYLVCFPSYAYLDMALAAYKVKYPNEPILVQQRDMNDEQRVLFIDQFQQRRDILAFGVLGGVFSEGIDYAGDQLLGVIIIGTGMPQPTYEQKAMAAYYRQLGLNEFQYAYQYPGFIKVLQAAGRVVRSPNDRGVIVFIEPRFQRVDYQKLFPHHWTMQYCSNRAELKQKLQNFWCCNDNSVGLRRE